MQFSKPTVVVSKCLGFDSCRYNGQMILVDFIEKMKPYVHFVPVCPEVAIGLGVPRDPIRIVSINGDLRLVLLILQEELVWVLQLSGLRVVLIWLGDGI